MHVYLTPRDDPTSCCFEIYFGQEWISIEIAERLWGHDIDGETWAIIYAMSKVRDVSIDTVAINELIGRKTNDNWQGMTSVEGERAERVIIYVKQQLNVA